MQSKDGLLKHYYQTILAFFRFTCHLTPDTCHYGDNREAFMYEIKSNIRFLFILSPFSVSIGNDRPLQKCKLYQTLQKANIEATSNENFKKWI